MKQQNEDKNDLLNIVPDSNEEKEDKRNKYKIFDSMISYICYEFIKNVMKNLKKNQLTNYPFKDQEVIVFTNDNIKYLEDRDKFIELTKSGYMIIMIKYSQNY